MFKEKSKQTKQLDSDDRTSGKEQQCLLGTWNLFRTLRKEKMSVCQPEFSTDRKKKKRVWT